MADADAGSWGHSADPVATFPPLAVSTENVNDLETWARMDPPGWRRIKAAVTGGSAIESEAGYAYAATLVSYPSLIEAANSFQQTYNLLQWLETFVNLHAHAIAGEEKPWQGKAAQAFLAKMDYLSEFLGRQADRLLGGAGMPDSVSVPYELMMSGSYLKWAQEQINYLDVEWAKIAAANKANLTDGGNVAISSTPYARPMTDQMLQVALELAKQYSRLSYDAVSAPDGDGSPAPTPPPPPAAPTPPPPPPPPPDPTPPPPYEPPTPPPYEPPTPPPYESPPTPPPYEPPPIPTPPPTEVAPPPTLQPPPGSDPPALSTAGPPTVDVPDDLGVESPEGSGPGLSPPPGASPPGGLPGLDPPVVGDPPGGGSGPGGAVSGGGPIPPMIPVPPAASSSGGGNSPRPAPPLVGDPPDGPGVPGGTPPGGVDLPGGGSSPGGVDLPGGTPPGGVDLPGGAEAPGLGQPPGATPPPGTAPAPGPMPGMPGSPGAGAGPGGGAAAERPDASGLLDGDQDDWSPGGLGSGDPSAPGGAIPGGPGVKEPEPGLASGGQPPVPGVPGGGAPMVPPMPGAPGSPGAGAGDGTPPERPDAAGLVEGDAADWGSAASDSSVGPEAPAGAAAGGAGLLRATSAAPATSAVPAPAVVPYVAPPMIPVPPTPPPAGGRDQNAVPRSDAADLLAAEGTAWQPDEAATGSVPVAGAPIAATIPVRATPPAVVGVPAPVSEDEERTPADRLDAGEPLHEDRPTWTGVESRLDENRVPIVRTAEAGADTSGWDDTTGAWWLHGEPEGTGVTGG
ncbi:hypothetical protein [Micromonospora sp. NPDC048898]|uniref:hypothetical protein n=1 Tax=Micromonospora sp. NPDC048898 TaxID=3364260 RepID=UPI0037211545